MLKFNILPLFPATYINKLKSFTEPFFGKKCVRFQEIVAFDDNLKEICTDNLIAHLIVTGMFVALTVIIIPGTIL